METAIAALIILTVVLSGVLTLTHAYLSSQDTILESWREMEERRGERARTDLSPVGATVDAGGATVTVILENEGDTKLADFDQWDVIVQYYRASGEYLVEWLPYVEGTEPGNNQWAVNKIYEAYETGILNPGEEMVVRIRLNPPVGPATTNLVTVATPNGISASTVFTR